MGNRVLLTGFNGKNNSSKILVEELYKQNINGVELVKAILPNSFEACERVFREALLSFKPDVVLAFGMKPRTKKVFLVRRAVNFDKAGLRKRGHTIAEEGPDEYYTDFPLDGIFNALQNRDTIVSKSISAGGYFCNHVYYYGLHLIKTLNLNTKMLFIHVPSMTRINNNEFENIVGGLKEYLSSIGDSH